MNMRSYHLISLLFIILSASAQTSTSPSHAPSTEPDEVSLSSSPSFSPTLKEVDQSPVPSSFPSSVPSLLASSVPSLDPSTGSSEPSEVLPSSNPSLNPTMIPESSAPSSMPSKVTDSPSTSTSDPSSTPSTVSPTFAPTASLDPSMAPSPLLTMSPSNSTDDIDDEMNEIIMESECAAYSACSELIGDCCPTVDDVFLYCCFESNSTDGYTKDFTFVGPSSEESAVQDEADYFLSTSPYFNPGRAPDGSYPTIAYARNATELYGMIYYKIENVIDDASEYVAEKQKFFVDIYSTAPACTQIILQLDNLALADPDNYPTGRHSRYITFTTRQNAWERLEFDFLDRPDSAMGDNIIDAMALFFSPGLQRDDTYYMRNLDSSTFGCEEMCEDPAPKSCAAPLVGEDGSCDDELDNDEDGLTDCEDFECTLDAACTASVSIAYATASSQLDSSGDSGSREVSAASAQIGMGSNLLLGLVGLLLTHAGR